MATRQGPAVDTQFRTGDEMSRTVAARGLRRRPDTTSLWFHQVYRKMDRAERVRTGTRRHVMSGSNEP